MSEYYCSHKPPCCPLLVTAHDHLQKMQVTNGSLTQEIDRLKAELEIYHEHDSRCQWIYKAEKLAEALNKAFVSLNFKSDDPERERVKREVIHCLAEHEKGV